LALAHDKNLHQAAAIDAELHDAVGQISGALQKILSLLKDHAAAALAALKENKGNDVCDATLRSTQATTTQGVYLLNADGDIKGCAVPLGLDAVKRMALTPTLHERSYFRISKSFREPFVSDSLSSIFNGNSAVFLCVPLTEGIHKQFSGLLFGAVQVGPWDLPINLAQSQWNKGRSFLLVDSQGICLLPPNDEFPIRDGTINPALTEEMAANQGFDYERLLALSRRDSLVKHVVEGIVPLSQDDDVFELSSDLQYYIVVSEVPNTRWKLAIAEPSRRTSRLRAINQR
jgi:hypothetical protein